MKKILALFVLSIILFSCEKKVVLPQNVQDLNSQKESLKKQIDSLHQKLKTVEISLAKLDTIKKAPVVTTITATKGIFKHFIEVQGTVKSDKSVELHPEMGGNILQIFVKEGQRVGRGQTLAQIDASIINNSIAQTQVQLDLAKTAFERQQRLWNQKIGSEMQFLQAKAQKEGLEKSISTLNAQAQKMKVTAPFSGVIDEIFAKVGALASPQMPFLRIVNLNKVYLESLITESYLKDIKKGAEVVITFPSLDKEITSKISEVGNFINPNDRSFKTRININNRDHQIKPNLLADVKVKDFESVGIIIPSYLIQKGSKNQTFVYTVQEIDGTTKAQKTIVTIAKEYNNESFVSEGLKADNLIIDKGARAIKNNDEVALDKK